MAGLPSMLRRVRVKSNCTVKGVTALVVTAVPPIVTEIETPFAPFIALVAFWLNWNCFNAGL